MRAQTCASDLLTYLEDHQAEMTALLEVLVRAESPSTEPERQQAVLGPLAGVLEAAGYHTRHLPGHETGGHLYARPHDRHTGQPVQLLVGHCDTVWPVGTLKEMPVRIEEERMYGPGIYDMKAGLVQLVFALQALHDLDLTPPVAPVVLVNSDEEMDSFESKATICRLARAADRAFVLEPSLGLAGRLKTARKGVGQFTITIEGQPAHAGLDPERGASAILELSHLIQQLHALNDPEQGITLNVGQVEGGSRPNVVAPTSRAVIDVRVPTDEDAQRVEARLRALKPTILGVQVKVEGGFSRPPMERTARNERLWERAQDAAAHLGLVLQEGTAGGASDGNETSRYTATLDGLGAVGDGAHARHEFVYLDKMVERAALLSLLLLEPPLQATMLQATASAVVSSSSVSSLAE